MGARAVKHKQNPEGTELRRFDEELRAGSRDPVQDRACK
jgi:hypothetical protein